MIFIKVPVIGNNGQTVNAHINVEQITAVVDETEDTPAELWVGNGQSVMRVDIPAAELLELIYATGATEEY